MIQDPDPVLTAPDLHVFGQVGAVVVAASLALVPLAILAARRIFPGRNVYFARWGFSHVIQVLLVAIAVGWASVLVFPRPAEGDAQDALVPNLVRSALVLGSAGVASLFVARKMSPEGWRALGLAPDRNARAIAAGLTSYVLLLPGVLGLGALSAWILDELGVEATPQEVLVAFQNLPPDAIPLALVLGIVVMPALEELVFRAFLQPLLVQNFSEKGGIAITSFLFAALHGVQAFLPIFGLSLVLGAVMLRTQRLAAIWAIHAAHNGLMLALVLLAPELPRAVEPARGLFGF